jgi:hypothetical protein
MVLAEGLVAIGRHITRHERVKSEAVVPVQPYSGVNWLLEFKTFVTQLFIWLTPQYQLRAQTWLKDGVKVPTGWKAYIV